MAVAGPAESAPTSKDAKDLKKIVEDNGIYVETAQKGVVLSGYVDTSYTYQFGSTAGPNGAGFGNPVTEAAGRQFDTKNNDFNINAFKLTLEKALSDKNEWSAGFRADLMFGEDASILAATDPATTPGGDLFLEQAYVSLRVPVGNGLDFKIGKFVTLLGYEIIESPGNLNFSRGFLFTNAIPLTHTGILMSYKFNDIVDAQFGVVNGWNNSDKTPAQDFPAITGRLAINAPGGNATLATSFIYSANGDNTGVAGNGNQFVIDVWGQWYPTFVADKKLLFALNGDYGYADQSPFDGVNGTSQWYGVAAYAKYQFTPVFSLASRGEWMHTDDGQKFGLPGLGTDVWSYTLTAGFNIWENVLTRVEYRYDRGEADTINGFDQHQIAVNVVYSF
ncbi:MAG: outer membrane beta-barrel protein [Candidatus Methylacidiphilales bacterium]